MSFLLNVKRIIPRAPVNTMDKSTIVSIFPKEIIEFKPTIQPGKFVIPAGSFAKPATLVVGSSSWWKEFDENQPMLEIPQASVLIADSVVKDFCNGILGCNMLDAMPGLFFIPGEITLATLMQSHKHQLEKARNKQNKWYEILVKMADILWSRTNGNPITITNDMKLAASELGLREKAWLKDHIASTEMSPCPACGMLRNTNFPVCNNCKTVVDKKKYESLGLAAAS